MRFSVRIKTGYFKTALYWLSVERGCLRLTPSADAGDREYLFPEDALLAVILLAGKAASIEIHSQNRLLEATLADGGQLPELLRALRQNLNTHITCEFMGVDNTP